MISEDDNNNPHEHIEDTVRINNILITNSLEGGTSSSMNFGSGAITFGGNQAKSHSRASKKRTKTSSKKSMGKSQYNLKNLLEVKHLVPNTDYKSSKKFVKNDLKEDKNSKPVSNTIIKQVQNQQYI